MRKLFYIKRLLLLTVLMLCGSIAVFAQAKLDVMGQVLDSNNEPIIGASVLVIGTSKGTMTDFNGKFAIKDVSSSAKLTVSYVGMKTKVVSLKGRRKLLITLQEDNALLKDLVVIGYGKMKKGDLSASVASVNNLDALKERPITNAAEMLQGQIPGVTVISNGGHPDSTPRITIRGMGSRNGESPLYVVDGVPGAPFNFSDVVSMTVLKDAASAAIYGAHAGSAGVILVTTKQAEAGKTSIEFSSVTGFSKASNLPQSLTIEEERRVREASLADIGQTLGDGWDPVKNPYIGQTRTDWIDEIFRTAPFQRYNVALSGGTESFSNRLSAEYSDKQGTLISTYKKELTLRINSNFTFGKFFRVREDLSWKNTKSRGANTSSSESGVILSALMMPRNAEVYNPDGTYGGTAPMENSAYVRKYGSNYSSIHGDAINPVRTLSANYVNNNADQVTTSTFLDIMEPIKGLNFSSRFTYKLGSYFGKDFSPRRPEPGKPKLKNSLTYLAQRFTAWDFENTLTYDRVFKRHNVGLMFSTTASEYQYRDFKALAENFASEDEALTYFSQAKSPRPSEDSFAKDRNVSYVGRIAYSYADRYFATLSMRRDYAGRLPKGHKYGDFPSATLAWKLTSEDFMPKSDILNMMKLRASWGRIGNLGSISRGYAYPLLSSYVKPDRGMQVGKDCPINTNGKYLATGFNPLLTWETSEQLDFGLDLAMFKNRLNVTFDYFIKDTKGLIKKQDAGWTNSIGIDAMLINDGEIQNKGIELAVNWGDKVGDVNYWLGANMATLTNRVTNIGAPDAEGNKPVWTEDNVDFRDTLSPFRTEEGQPLYSFWLIESQGVFKSQAELDAHKDKNGKLIQPNARIGDLKFLDKNGDGKISDEDRIFMGNAMPKLTYSFNGGLSWNNFTLGLMLQGVGGVKVFNAYKFTTLNESVSNFNRSNKILEALNGPSDEVPRISKADKNGNFATNSDFYLESGDYLRIKNLSLGYSFKHLFPKIQALDLTFSIDNLATFTSYSGIDPEVGGIGFDAGQYPVSRTYSLSFKLKF